MVDRIPSQLINDQLKEFLIIILICCKTYNRRPTVTFKHAMGAQAHIFAKRVPFPSSPKPCTTIPRQSLNCWQPSFDISHFPTEITCPTTAETFDSILSKICCHRADCSSVIIRWTLENGMKIIRDSNLQKNFKVEKRNYFAILRTEMSRKVPPL